MSNVIKLNILPQECKYTQNDIIIWKNLPSRQPSRVVLKRTYSGNLIYILIFNILLQLKTSFLKNVQARNHKYTIFANFPEVQLYLRIVLGYLVIKIPYFSEFHDTTQTGSWLLSSQSLVYTILVYSDAGWISSSSWLDCHSDLDVFV